MVAVKKNQIDKAALVAAQSQAFLQGTAVWAPSQASEGSTRKTDSIWIRGIVEGVTRGAEDEVVLNITLENGELGQYKASECFLQNEKDDTVDDLVRSDFLHEPGILHTLRARYELDMIYTYSGQILIAVNPHKSLNHLYGQRMMSQYKDIPFGDLSPHTYAVAEAAYSAMMIDEKRQAILISGESGAGKTESAKMVMQYLAHRSGPTFDDPTITVTPIEQQILESNPLLEAFGNAKTERNHNSSRFGKFVEIDFDMTGRISGASISTYLLERSRVVSIAPSERSFHIFYQLCFGSSEELKKKLRLPQSPSGFDYLAQSNTFVLDGIDDKDGFANTLNAMHVIGLDDHQIESVLKCVAAILHLGNIRFEIADNAMADEAIVCSDASSISGLEAAAHLLGTSSQALQKALMSRTITTAGEKIEKQFTVLESVESRDSLAKSLYSRLFDWLVLAVNQKIGSVGGVHRSNLSVGILDIYGFESFETNSFEQLCINLANEKLQQAFNSHIFKAEQNEYAQEGIDWSYIEFIDNQDVLDLLEGTCLSNITLENLPEKNMGVFPMIDEACRLPRATSQGLATSLRSKLDKHPRFSAPKRDQYSFVVNHYAGEVRYAVDNLLEKNRDFKVEDQEALMRSCNHPLPANLYPETTKEAVRSSFKLNTIGSTFRAQLNILSETLNKCQPHFIRCIKPNEASLPGNLKPAYAMEQLRAGGVLEAVRIACAGYPTRKPFFSFAQRYFLLLNQHHLSSNQIPLTGDGFIEWSALSEEELSKLVRMILVKANLSGWQVGRTRVFLRTGQLAILEGLRGQILTNAAVCVQKNWRGFTSRRNFALIIDSITTIQAAWRSYMLQKMLSNIRKNQAAARIQAQWRMLVQRRIYIYDQRRSKATIVQSYWRMYAFRKEFKGKSDYLKQVQIENDLIKKQSNAAILIQAYWRRSMAIQKANVLYQTSLKFSNLLKENEILKSELHSWREKHSLLYAEYNLLKEAGATPGADEISSQLKREYSEKDLRGGNLEDNEEKYQNYMESSGQETLYSLQNEIRLLRDSLDQSLEREKLTLQSLCEEKENVQIISSDLQRIKLESMSLIEGTALLEQKLAQAGKDNQNHVDTIAELKESELCKDKQLCKLSDSLEEMKMTTQSLKEKLLEQSQIISSQENANAVLSSRVESLLAQIEVIEQEKSNMSLQVTQLKEEMEQYASKQKGSSTTASFNPGDLSAGLSLGKNHEVANEANVLNPSKTDTVQLFISSFINQRPNYVNIFGKKSESNIYLPFASWILRNCVNEWVEHWNPVEVDLAINLISRALLRESQKNLASCINAIHTICASGAMLKVDSVGRKNSMLYVGISENLINQSAIYKSFGLLISKKIPINVSVLLTEDAKRLARSNYLKQDSRNFEDRLDVMGSSKSSWKTIIGSLTNLAITLREEKMPTPLIKSAVWATMRYIDGSILNGILMRRDLCSVSSAKALLTALSILEGYITCLPGGPDYSTQEFRESFQRSTQAAHFIIEGFSDCSRKARAGVGIKSAIRKCSALTLQQIYRLAELQHDDWLSSAYTVGSERKTLLEALKSMLEEPSEESNQVSEDETEHSWVMFGGDETSKKQASTEHVIMNEDFKDLLVDPMSDFNLNARGFARRQMILNSKMYFQINDTSLNGPEDVVDSTVFSKIEEACRKVPIPEQIRACPELKFLTTCT